MSAIQVPPVVVGEFVAPLYGDPLTTYFVIGDGTRIFDVTQTSVNAAWAQNTETYQAYNLARPMVVTPEPSDLAPVLMLTLCLWALFRQGRRLRLK